MNSNEKLISKDPPPKSEYPLDQGKYIIGGGLEATFHFHREQYLPHGVAFHLLDYPEHHALIRSFYERYLAMAKKNKLIPILESITWRANPDWGYKMGYTPDEIKKVNIMAMKLMEPFKSSHESVVLCGCVGPRFDNCISVMDLEHKLAKRYHFAQIAALKEGGADLINASGMNNVAETIGIVLASKEMDIPVLVSFALDKEGTLLDGTTVWEAIEAVDSISDEYCIFYMVHCQGPKDFCKYMAKMNGFSHRVKGVRLDRAEMLGSMEKSMEGQVEISPDLYYVPSFFNKNPMVKVIGFLKDK